jgi:hypothetical protein
MAPARPLPADVSGECGAEHDRKNAMSEVELTEAVPAPVEIRNQKPPRVRLPDEPIRVQVVRFSMCWGDMFGLIFKFLICVTPAVVVVAILPWMFWGVVLAGPWGTLGHARWEPVSLSWTLPSSLSVCDINPVRSCRPR